MLSDTYYSNMPQTQQQLPDICSICCELSSSKTMCQLNERAQPPYQFLPFQISEMRDTHVHFIRPVAPTPRSEPSKLQVQNMHRNSAVGLPQNN